MTAAVTDELLVEVEQLVARADQVHVLARDLRRKAERGERARRKRQRGELPMSIVRAKRIALGAEAANLGQPGKLPGYSWGISATACQRGSQLATRPGTVCSGCYARKNFYATWRPVQIAHRRRLQGIRHPDWVDAMVTLILSHTEPCDPYFRWFDSGDLQSVEHLHQIVRVCRRTPWVRHWLPTHEHQMVAIYLRGEAAEIPPNLCLRLSADMIDEPPKLPRELRHLPTSTVHRGHGNDKVVQVSDDPKDSIECRAYTVASREGAAGLCRSCRACWEPRLQNVSYPIH